MGSSLDDLTMIENKNLVRILDRRQAMGNDERRSSFR